MALEKTKLPVEVDGVTVSTCEANQGGISEEIVNCVFTGMLLGVYNASYVSPPVPAGQGCPSL